MTTTTMDMERVTLPTQAERIQQLRERILDDTRATALAEYDRMLSADLEEGGIIARAFLSCLCGQFDHLARVERGEA